MLISSLLIETYLVTESQRLERYHGKNFFASEKNALRGDSHDVCNARYALRGYTMRTQAARCVKRNRKRERRFFETRGNRCCTCALRIKFYHRIFATWTGTTPILSVNIEQTRERRVSRIKGTKHENETYACVSM